MIKLNRKGFTLIELIAVIVIISILLVLIVPSALSSSDKGKEASYNILVQNIKTAAENYYLECEYGDNSNISCYWPDDNKNKLTVTIGDLANYGFLSVTDKETDELIVLDPRNNDNNFNNCEINIVKNKDNNGKVTYVISNSSSETNDNCPSDEEYNGSDK